MGPGPCRRGTDSSRRERRLLRGREAGGGTLPEWPAEGMQLGRRRAASMAYRDRTQDDPPIAWEAVVDGVLPHGIDASRFAERFREAIASHPAAFGAGVPNKPDCDWQETALARFLVRASTREEAQTTASEVQREALEAAFAEVPPSKDVSWVSSLGVEPAGDPDRD
jgi:hypothetical protein